jgi:ubiquinone/menaquinone biosynthesis C-methylase UbiE
LLDDPLNSAVEHGLDWIALGKLFEELGQIETAVQLYERGLEHDLPEETYWETAQRLSFVHKRHDNLPAAVERWREAAGSGQIYAHVELDKFYEHRQRDYDVAAQWTRAALERVNAPDCPHSMRRQWLADLEHRLARLERKSGSSEGRVSNELKDRSRSQFGASAEAYATSDVHARGESLAILVELVKPQSSWQALDVATGAGHTALAFAPYVAHVIATDLTEEMLVKTAELVARRGLTNVETRLADAEALPFTDAAFDLVTCRLAFHHFPNPRLVISEFARVLKPGGVFGFSDNIVVPDERAANYYNAYEKLRDPSHHRVYSLVQLQAMFEEAGLSVEAVHQLSKEIEFHDWADRQHVSQTDKEKLLAMMRHIPEALKPLFAPRRADGTLYFSLWEVVIVGTSAVR